MNTNKEKLVIEVVGAHNLMPKDGEGLSSPFVREPEHNHNHNHNYTTTTTTTTTTNKALHCTHFFVLCLDINAPSVSAPSSLNPQFITSPTKPQSQNPN
ncbi:hypothetical protein CsSME_00009170 [Camellia sinensis var. sinensis]